MDIVCPVCYGEEPIYLGPMGSFEWFRCRWCGIDFHVSTDELMDVEIGFSVDKEDFDDDEEA